MAGHQPEFRAALTRRQLLVKVSLTAALVMSGCQSAQKLEVTQSGAPKFERFRAEYRFDNADQLLGRSFADVSSGSETPAVQRVAAESFMSEARLKIECPHPAGDPSLALLTLTLSDRRGPGALLHKEARQLTIERSNVELLISSLANNGYFDQPSDIVGGNELVVQIDRGKINREWINDARLLDLARQALVDGKPVR